MESIFRTLSGEIICRAIVSNTSRLPNACIKIAVKDCTYIHDCVKSWIDKSSAKYIVFSNYRDTLLLYDSNSKEVFSVVIGNKSLQEVYNEENR